MLRKKVFNQQKVKIIKQQNTQKPDQLGTKILKN